MSDDRAAFEKWVKSKRRGEKSLRRSAAGNGYVDSYTNAKWRAWQAARAQSGQVEPVCDCISQEDGYWQQRCECRNSGDLAEAQSWCDHANTQPPEDNSQ